MLKNMAFIIKLSGADLTGHVRYSDTCCYCFLFVHLSKQSFAYFSRCYSWNRVEVLLGEIGSFPLYINTHIPQTPTAQHSDVTQAQLRPPLSARCPVTNQPIIRQRRGGVTNNGRGRGCALSVTRARDCDWLSAHLPY